MARPTHRLVAKRRNGDEQGRPIGAGWVNDRGWISIKLNPCVVISYNDDVYLNLYPVSPPDPDSPPLRDEDEPQGGDDVPF